MTAGLVGSRLGKYEVLEEIGQGGMSVVYRATDTQLKRDVAIKVMHAFLAEQEEARERFHREAVAVARLRHPHIIEIFDYSGEDADTSYIVTELVRGSALAEVLRKGTLRPPEAGLLLARPIAQALAHAHANGVIHRDLKPENILVGENGSLKLTDFGIARMLDSHTLTMTGTLLGSPAYMAPEYVEGYATDERADIFSFGAMLYQFAVGSLPFEAPTPHALLKRIATGDFTPVEQANPSVHCGLARIIEKCLQRLPENRYANAGELIADIDTQLSRVGLDADRDLPLLLADRETFADRLERDLLPRYIALGKAELAAGRRGAATDDFNRVLALDPDNKDVRKILDRLARRAHARRVVRDVAIVAVGTLLITVGGGLAIDAIGLELANRARAEMIANRPPDPEPEPIPLPSDQNVTFVLQGTGDLYIDGDLIKKAASGLLPWFVKPGKHEIKFIGARTTATKPIEVFEDKPTKPLELNVVVRDPVVRPEAPKRREVEFSTVRWVHAYVDGKQVRKNIMGVFTLELEYGEHELRFVNPAFEAWDETVTIGENEPPNRVVIKIEPLPAKLLVKGGPEELIVDVAGERHLIDSRMRDDPIFVPLELAFDESFQKREVVVAARNGGELVRETISFRPGEEHELVVRP